MFYTSYNKWTKRNEFPTKNEGLFYLFFYYSNFEVLSFGIYNDVHNSGFTIMDSLFYVQFYLFVLFPCSAWANLDYYFNFLLQTSWTFLFSIIERIGIRCIVYDSLQIRFWTFQYFRNSKRVYKRYCIRAREYYNTYTAYLWFDHLS